MNTAATARVALPASAGLTSGTGRTNRPVPAGYRWLHAFYARGTAVNHWLRRRVRMPGIACGVAIALGTMFCLGNQRKPVFGAYALSCGLGGAAFVGALARGARLRAVRELPRHATAGEAFRYRVRLTNLSPRRLRHAWLQETVPDSRPSPERFAFSREPDEESRNPFDRLFAYYRWRWLEQGGRLFGGGTTEDPLVVEGRGTAQVTITLRPRRRGVLRLADLRVLLPDPCGLFQRCRRVANEPATVAVLPRRYHLPPLNLPGSARFELGGEALSNAIGSSGEFIGLRDYQPGDPPRIIHWKSWARTGRPIVRELEDIFFPRHGLVLDTFPAAGEEEAFEESVSVAASFAATLEHSECLLDLMFIQGKAHVFTAGRGIARAERMLETLAAVDAEPNEDFDTLTHLVFAHRDDLASCLCVFTGWSESRARFLRRVADTGVPLVALGVRMDRHATDAALAAHPPAVPVHWLTVGSIAADLQQLPAHLGRTS